jgi:Co/Zn/Cd efflux system component
VESAARLGCVLALNVFMIAELVVAGLFARSLSILAAGDFAVDSVVPVLGLVAVTIRDRGDSPVASGATTAVGLINGAALPAVSVLVVAEAIRRLLADTSTVQGLPMLIVSVISTVVKLVAALILGWARAARICTCAQCCSTPSPMMAPLMRDDWTLVPQAIRIAGRTARAIRINIGFTASYHAIGLALAAFGILPMMLAAAAQSLPDLGVLVNSARLLRHRPPTPPGAPAENNHPSPQPSAATALRTGAEQT